MIVCIYYLLIFAVIYNRYIQFNNEYFNRVNYEIKEDYSFKRVRAFCSLRHDELP